MMKQWYLPCSIVLAGAVSVSGCVDADDSIQILRNQSPTAGCVIPSDEGALFISRGRIDVAASSGYLFTPLIRNQGVTSGAAERLVFVEGANVDLSFPNDDVTASSNSLVSFRQPFSGSIAAQGLSSFAFEVLPKALLDEIGSGLAVGETRQVLAEIEVLGTMDGGEVSSNVFSYPIEVCNGCLQNVLGSCEQSFDNIQLGGSCQTLQDGVIDCCTNADGSLTCPAVTITPDPA